MVFISSITINTSHLCDLIICQHTVTSPTDILQYPVAEGPIRKIRGIDLHIGRGCQ